MIPGGTPAATLRAALSPAAGAEHHARTPDARTRGQTRQGETAMNRNTLARAYAAQTAQPGRAPAAQPSPRSEHAGPPAAGLVAPARPAAEAPSSQAAFEDALLIAVRRSLASCRDSSQLRMLAAFEARR
jgi:hypothetical protein